MSSKTSTKPTNETALTPRRNILIVPAHHLFAAILTKNLLNSGYQYNEIYRFGPQAPDDVAGGIYVRGSTTENNAIDRVLKDAKINIVIHILLRNSEPLESENMTENEVYVENVRDTNALLQALARWQKNNAHLPIKPICVSGARSQIVDDILGNTILAAETLWFGRALRHEWQTLVIRAATSVSPWDTAFIEFCFGVWDLGLHPQDLSDALVLIVDQLTNGLESPLILRSKPLELENVNQGIENITQAEKMLMQKYGFELEGKYEETEERDNEGKEEKKGDVMATARQALIGNWKPQYHKRQVLQDLSTFGYKGPPKPNWLIKKSSNTFSNNDGISAVMDRS